MTMLRKSYQKPDVNRVKLDVTVACYNCCKLYVTEVCTECGSGGGPSKNS